MEAAVERQWNFEEGAEAGWLPMRGAWRTEAGALHCSDPFFSGAALSLMPGRWMGDFRVELDLSRIEPRGADEGGWAGIAFPRTDILTGAGRVEENLLLLRADGGLDLLAGGQTLARRPGVARPQSAALCLTLERRGGLLRVGVDGQQILELETEQTGPVQLGLALFGCEATFAALRMRGQTAPQPRHEPQRLAQPQPSRQPAVDPLPRVTTRVQPGQAGGFVRSDTGEPFLPRGFNHTNLGKVEGGWHMTFNTGIYEGYRIDRELEAMAALGANVVRVWAWGVQDATGFTAGDATRLHRAYMENFVDFLRRATHHGLYVIPILDEMPHNSHYDSISHKSAQPAPQRRRITGNSAQYLAAGPIAAKAACAADFVRYVRRADPGLLRTVLAWELANEVCVYLTEGPFLYTSGMVETANGKRYDMGDPVARQACWDDGIRHWANRLADAIHAEDPEALVTAGMWTSDAHARPPVHGMRRDGADPRIPPRPSALAGADCRLDFLDVHFYPWGGSPQLREDCHERPALIASGKPALVGEYGTFRTQMDVQTAKDTLREMQRQMHATGYAGSLFWVWDLTPWQEHPCYSAVEHDFGALAMQLARDANKKSPEGETSGLAEGGIK